MKYDTPTEFKNIVYRNDYKDTDIDENNLFHPVKDISKHKYYRDMLKNKVYIEWVIRVMIINYQMIIKYTPLIIIYSINYD